MATVTIEEKLLSKQNSRNIIRAKLVELGLAESSAKLDALATIIDNITNQGAVSVSLQEGQTYTIPKGYHNGSGTVSGVAGGGDYKLEPTKTVTPTKQQQSVTPSSGYYGLEGVTVGAIPAIYQDVSSVTAAKEDVLSGKVIVLADGTVVAGNMVDNGTVTKILDATTVSYTIPAGKHSGTGTVSITLESKTVTPSKSAQTITPTAGKVLGEVIVNPIPGAYQDVSGVTAKQIHVLEGAYFVDKSGNLLEGKMPEVGSYNKTLYAGGSCYIPEGYHDGTGVVDARPLAEQTPGTAGAGDILEGCNAWVDGVRVSGTMADNGGVSGSVDGITTTSFEVPAGYTSGGEVAFDDSKIVEMLDAI